MTDKQSYVDRRLRDEQAAMIDDRDWFEAVVETPKGSRNKYQIDAGSGEVWLDRHLFTAMTYPTDYGFAPNTLAIGGDPLDIMVLLDEPTVPGCHIRVRAVAVFALSSNGVDDPKILAVPANDPRWESVADLDDVPVHMLLEIRQFFTMYHELEPSRQHEVGRWQDRAWAEAELATAFARHVDSN